MPAQRYNGFDTLFSSLCALRTLNADHSQIQYITAYRLKLAIRRVAWSEDLLPALEAII